MRLVFDEGNQSLSSAISFEKGADEKPKCET